MSALALRSYDRIAPWYDLLALLWTGGAIGAAGAAVAERVRAGQTALVAGVGGGRDAAALARAGARLTLVDLSPRMLERAGARVLAVDKGVPELVPGDALALPEDRVFDVVCAHYFLNLFAADEVAPVLARLASHVAPGGLLSIADFAPVPAGRPLQALHYAVPMRFFTALGLCARHPTYDYASLLPPGWRLEAVQGHRVFGVGPRWHTTWLARSPLD